MTEQQAPERVCAICGTPYAFCPDPPFIPRHTDGRAHWHLARSESIRVTEREQWLIKGAYEAGKRSRD